MRPVNVAVPVPPSVATDATIASPAGSIGVSTHWNVESPPSAVLAIVMSMGSGTFSMAQVTATPGWATKVTAAGSALESSTPVQVSVPCTQPAADCSVSV